jgi:thiosulfate dehydrogenase [quinone] large subunit
MGTAKNLEYTAGAFLTRFFIGIMFLTAGVGKFVGGYTNYVNMFTGMFAQSWVPQVVTTPVIYVIPIIEVVLGLLLILGLWSNRLLFVAGLVITMFAAGALTIGMADTLAYNAVYLLVIGFALYLYEYDEWRLGR